MVMQNTVIRPDGFQLLGASDLRSGLSGPLGFGQAERHCGTFRVEAPPPPSEKSPNQVSPTTVPTGCVAGWSPSRFRDVFSPPSVLAASRFAGTAAQVRGAWNPRQRGKDPKRHHI